MEENENNTNNSNTSNNTTFKSVNNVTKQKVGFTKGVLIPFLSGIVGASLVVGGVFGVTEVRTKLMEITGKNTSAQSQSTTQNQGQVNATAVSLTEYSDTAIGVAAKVLPSIVGIEIEYNVNSIFGTSKATASGSGIIISEDGYILTNNHVVSSETTNSQNSFYQVSTATKIKVKLYNDDNIYEAQIVGTDDETDLAVIKIEKTGLTVAEFADSSTVQVGEFAMAIGNPLGLSTSVTCGIVSAVNVEVTADNQTYHAIQTDAAINSGNSGGALVNSQGQVIGINTLKLAGEGVEGIGFAIPINDTLDVTSQLIEHKKVLRPYVGITGRTLDENTAKQYNLVVGVYVQSVDDFSAAQLAGIQAGDVITEFDGKTVTKVDEITEIKEQHKIGDTVSVKIYRNGEYKELSLTFREQP